MELGNMELGIKLLTEHATLPTKAHAGDLGFDLYAAEELQIEAHQVGLVSTGIACRFPTGYGALLRDRSSIATKYGLFVVAGVIDNGYTGEIKVALYNSNCNKFARVERGDKIAQMILTAVNDSSLYLIEELETTSRGDKGFGSSGS